MPGIRGAIDAELKTAYATYRDNEKVSALVRQIHLEAQQLLKDAYLVEFLDLQPAHAEADLQHQLVAKPQEFYLQYEQDQEEQA